MKKLDNKGFSLVELIIVIAIMAILAGALAPMLLRYIEKSREATDVTNMKNCRSAAEAALADGALVEGGKYYYHDNGEISTAVSKRTYGKGKAIDGKTEYDGYDTTEDVTGDFLCVEIKPNDEIDVYWSNH